MFQLGLDPCVFWVCLDTMVRQLRATGDTNLASYSRHLATHHQLQLSSCQLYIQVNRYIRHYLYRVFSKGRIEVGPCKSLIFRTFPDVLYFI